MRGLGSEEEKKAAKALGDGEERDLPASLPLSRAGEAVDSACLLEIWREATDSLKVALVYQRQPVSFISGSLIRIEWRVNESAHSSGLFHPVNMGMDGIGHR